VPKEIELWQFIGDHLSRGERIAFLVVAKSFGSSPGRAGYKMAVAENGDLIGSIGGGVMEVNLVEQARRLLSEPPVLLVGFTTEVIEQEHRKNSDHPSGMICSGGQTVLRRVLTPSDIETIDSAAEALQHGRDARFIISESSLTIGRVEGGIQSALINFDRYSDTEFIYSERLGPKNQLIIIGGGHCALALSELMSRMDFSIRIFDDRPELNTLEKNEFADQITVIDNYEEIASHIDGGDDVYVVVMTLGFKTDAVVMRNLLGRRFKYFGVLGSRAKMGTLLRELRDEGYPQDQLDAIRTPIGIQINSRTPEEIAVSIAAEIISVKNS
jgi:xanthine dehydrogenase accessory factor